MKGGDFDEGMETHQGGPLAGARARAHPRGGGGLPAARHGARDRGRLRRRARRARHRRRLLRGERSRATWSTRASAAWPTCCASSATGSAPASSRTTCASRARARTHTLVADGILGSIHAFRGEWSAARPLLVQCLDTASRLDVVSMSVDSAAALAWWRSTRATSTAPARTAASLLERWARSEDHHYAVWGLRWASCFFARHGSLGEARACAEALSSIAAATGHPDALAALAHALGETALAEGDPDAAAEQLGRAAELHDEPRDPVRASADPATCRRRARRVGSARRGDRAARRGAPHGAPPRGRAAGRRGGRRGRPARRVGRAATRTARGGRRTRTPASPAASSR